MRVSVLGCGGPAFLATPARDFRWPLSTCPDSSVGKTPRHLYQRSAVRIRLAAANAIAFLAPRCWSLRKLFLFLLAKTLFHCSTRRTKKTAGKYIDFWRSYECLKKLLISAFLTFSKICDVLWGINNKIGWFWGTYRSNILSSNKKKLFAPEYS